jgi:AcrR family transcriptional regulator
MRILDAAEELFATHGFHGTSVRAICAAADANVAAVHYHFGGKDQVVEAIFERRMPALAARRKAFLDQLYAAKARPSVRSLIQALVLPLADLMHSDGETALAYIRAFAALLRDCPDLVWTILNKHNADNMRRIDAGLQQALPQLSPKLINQRMTIAGETVINCLSNSANFTLNPSDEDSRPSLADFAEHLTDFVAGGFSAQVTLRLD